MVAAGHLLLYFGPRLMTIASFLFPNYSSSSGPKVGEDRKDEEKSEEVEEPVKKLQRIPFLSEGLCNFLCGSSFINFLTTFLFHLFLPLLDHEARSSFFYFKVEGTKRRTLRRPHDEKFEKIRNVSQH